MRFPLVLGGLFTALSCHREPSIPNGGSGPVAAASSGADTRFRAGMTVYQDPVTGKIGPMPPTARAQIAPGANMSMTGLTEVRSPGGGTMVRLQGRFQNYVTVRAEGDGQVRTQCEERTSP